MKKIILQIIIAITFFTSCNTTKKTTGSTRAMSVKKVIKTYKNNEFSKETVQAKAKLHFENSNTSQNISIKVRIKKDEVIWMSGSVLGFPVAKVKITPTSVQFYEKITKTYFDGDFRLINDALGADLDYFQLQNIFFGQAFSNLSDKKYQEEITPKAYVLTPKEQHTLYAVFYWVNPTIFRLDKQEIKSLQEPKILSISYPEYYKISGDYFPKSTKILAKEDNKRTIIDINYKSVEFNKRLTFPFEIPSGYKEINPSNF